MLWRFANTSGSVEVSMKQQRGMVTNKQITLIVTLDSTHSLHNSIAMDGPGHLLSLKVMRLSVRVCSNDLPRLFVMFVPSSDPLWLAHGNPSIPVPPHSQPTPRPLYSPYRVVRPSQGIPRHCVI